MAQHSDKCDNCGTKVDTTPTKTYDYNWNPITVNFCDRCHAYEAQFTNQETP